MRGPIILVQAFWMKVKSSLNYWNFFRGLLCTKVSRLSEFWFYSIFWKKKNNWNILWENHSFSIVVGSLGWFLLKVKSSLIHRNFFQGCFAQKYISFWFYFFAIYFLGTFYEKITHFLLPLFLEKSGLSTPPPLTTEIGKKKSPLAS